MIALVQHIKRHGLWSISLAYGAISMALLAVAWTLIVGIAGFNPLYVQLLAVFSILGLPLALGLAWAIREPMDPGGKGHVVRD